MNILLLMTTYLESTMSLDNGSTIADNSRIFKLDILLRMFDWFKLLKISHSYGCHHYREGLHNVSLCSVPQLKILDSRMMLFIQILQFFIVRSDRIE